MKVLGIIAEYNPFHNGHLYHLKESVRITEPDYTVCVMSGNFTQRGEPAMADKWIRASAAVKNGIDLVLELPFAFACNNAEYFAAGAVDIFNRLGCVTHLSFGSEAGDLSALSGAAEYLSYEDEELKNSIKEFADQGISFPRARYEAVRKCKGEIYSDVLKSSNNILAVEYLKQLYLTKSSIEPVTVKRYGTGYHDKGSFEDIASASAIRRQLGISGNMNEVFDFLPSKTYEVLQSIDRGVNISFNDFYQVLLYQILTSDTERLGTILSATEGLENRVKKAAAESVDMDSMIKAVLSKRYTDTRIHRLLTHILIHLDKESFRDIWDHRINYGRVLAFSQKGASLLKQIKKKEMNSIPILTNINREISRESGEWKLLKYDITASDVYNLIAYGEIYTHSDYVRKPYKDFE
ncbi:MAG TPA: nucleotidyltransferase [Anaerovoracaceae bacterium]|nr:nucleotidyltransferase [Anaerovoracaceae bacterium]